jgi:hypothetical protein
MNDDFCELQGGRWMWVRVGGAVESRQARAARTNYINVRTIACGWRDLRFLLLDRVPVIVLVIVLVV